jgi:tripartite-type tricarboxylate transporter receptor subunit TctC
MMHAILRVLPLLTSAALFSLSAAADETSAGKPAGFKDETVQMYIGYSAGGGYDVYARLVARFFGAHLPGHPDVVPTNMPGAGSLRLANWLYNVAPHDGTAIGAVARGIAFDPLLNPGDQQYDATKFNWLGSANNEVSICAAWHTTGVKTLDDLKTREITVGGTGGAADTDQFPKIINGVLGTKMRLIAGYPGGNDINLAMERGEVGGRCGWSWSSVVATRPDWVKEKKISVLVQLAMQKHPDLKDVPLIIDLAKSNEDKQMFRLVFARQTMGRPFVLPPGVPDQTVPLLRRAFMETMKDPAFKAEAEKGKLEVEPVDGEEVQRLVEEAYNTPKPVVQHTVDLLK